MATNSPIQFLDITINGPNVEEEIWPVVKSLRPQWTKEDTCTQAFSKGVINSMVCFYHKSDSNRDDAMVVRINGDALNSIKGMNNREREFVCLQIAQEAGCFPAIYACFNNGMIYKFSPGRVMTYRDFRNPSIIKQITKKLHRFHHTDVDGLSLVNRRGEPTTFPKNLSRTDGFAYVQDYIDSLPEGLPDPEKDAQFQKFRDELSTDFLQKELDVIKDIFAEIGTPIVLSHGDFHCLNMIYDEARDIVSFIDYEATLYKYESRDIVTVFGFYPFMYKGKMVNQDDPGIDEEHRLIWLRSYLEAMYEASGKKADEVPEVHLELMDAEHRIMQTAYMLELIIFFLNFVATEKRFDVFQFIKLARDLYFEGKDDLPELKNRCLQLKSQVPNIKAKQ